MSRFVSVGEAERGAGAVSSRRSGSGSAEGAAGQMRRGSSRRPSSHPTAGNGQDLHGRQSRTAKGRVRQVPRRDCKSRRTGPHLTKGFLFFSTTEPSSGRN